MAKTKTAEPETLRERWTREAKRVLVGKRIVDAGYVDGPDELGTDLCFALEDGTQLYVMSDDEGNGPGALHFDNPVLGGGILPQLR